MIRSLSLCPIVALVGCLPALDDGLVAARPDASDATTEPHVSECVDNKPDTVIEGDEECDDGNYDETDGCTQDCKRDCIGPDRIEVQGTCYFLQSESTTFAEAYAQCMSAGNGAHILTLRSPEESGSVATQLLAKLNISKVMVGLRVDNDGVTWNSVAPGEPGWSASKECPGCYSDWNTGQPQVDATRRVAVMNRDEGWRWTVESVLDRFALVCERELPGRPKNLCTTPCDPKTTYEFTWKWSGAFTYRVQFLPSTYQSAKAECEGADYKLIDFRSEAERAMVVRYGPYISFWTGLARAEDAGAWTWTDPGTTADIPWADDSQAGQTGAGSLVVTTSFDTNLMQARNPNILQASVCRREGIR